jgi:hypothetical protein
MTAEFRVPQRTLPFFFAEKFGQLTEAYFEETRLRTKRNLLKN